MSRPDGDLPQHSPKMLQWFSRYCRWYVPKRFHRVMVQGDVPEGGFTSDQGGTVFYMNHPGWFDPLMGIVLADRYFQAMTHFAVIDAEMLEQYKFFQKMGFMGVQQDSPRGGVQFLRQALRILHHDRHALWLTAQGHFADVRERPITLQPGLAHLARRMKTGMIIPIAIEYAFWFESKPEALIRFGNPIKVNDHVGSDVQVWQRHLTDYLDETMQQLAASSQARDAEAFETILGGSAGVGGVYDAWRRVKAWAGGRRFDASHGGAMTRARESQS